MLHPGGNGETEKGRIADITKGENAGDFIALDHVLPRAIAPELAARFYNLEAIPARHNLAKSAKITQGDSRLPAGGTGKVCYLFRVSGRLR